jgi:hypothetical protein
MYNEIKECCYELFGIKSTDANKTDIGLIKHD